MQAYTRSLAPNCRPKDAQYRNPHFQSSKNGIDTTGCENDRHLVLQAQSWETEEEERSWLARREPWPLSAVNQVVLLAVYTEKRRP